MGEVTQDWAKNLGWRARKQDLATRFWRKVQKDTPESCWIWTGNKRRTGHGVIFNNGKSRSASRVVWEMDRGPIPAGMQVLHKCDNAPCVNPDHLYVGTYQDNNRDKTERGRCYRGGPTKPLRGEDHPRAIVNAETVEMIRIFRLAYEPTPSYAQVGREFGISKELAVAIVKGCIWKTVPIMRWATEQETQEFIHDQQA